MPIVKAVPFEFTQLEISDVLRVEPQVFPDSRGEFAEFFKLSDFTEIGAANPLTQVNYSRSEKGVLRGLHYQNPPKAQAKLVSCIAGEIFDVAVDIRKGSHTYGKWVGEKLSASTKHMLYIPAGFAHGFCVLSEQAELIYFCDEQYSPEHEGGIIWNDSTIGIEWPVADPVVSDKDAAFLPLKEAEHLFTYE